MRDMDLLDDLGTALDPAGPPPERLRRRVLTGAMTPTRNWRPRLPRLGLRLGVAAGLAAAVTAGVLVLQVVPFGGKAPASQAQAADVLRGAADQAQRLPAVRVGANQFVYVESIATVLGMNASTGADASTAAVKRQVWFSVDGTRDGLVQEQPRAGGQWTGTPIPGCRDGVSTQRKYGKEQQVPCTPEPAYNGDLPTNADAMLAYLYRDADGTKNPRDQQAFTAAADLIREAYLSPASLAAVFGALARIPGVTVTGDVTDEAGRHGVAVALTEVQGTRTELIFDRRSHAFLGERTVLVRDQDGLTAGQVAYSVAVLAVRIVDAVTPAN